MAESKSNYLSVRIGNHWYGIEVSQVIEVLHLVAFTEIPAVRDDILGLITVRDEVMPLIDLRRQLGSDDIQLRLDSPVVAIREGAGAIALLFDDADRVEEIRDSQITTSHEAQQFPCIRAVARLPGRMLLLLDTKLISEGYPPAKLTKTRKPRKAPQKQAI